MSCDRFFHPLCRSTFQTFLDPKLPKPRRLFLSTPRRCSLFCVRLWGKEGSGKCGAVRCFSSCNFFDQEQSSQWQTPTSSIWANREPIKYQQIFCHQIHGTGKDSIALVGYLAVSVFKEQRAAKFSGSCNLSAPECFLQQPRKQNTYKRIFPLGG